MTRVQEKCVHVLNKMLYYFTFIFIYFYIFFFFLIFLNKKKCKFYGTIDLPFFQRVFNFLRTTLMNSFPNQSFLNEEDEDLLYSYINDKIEDILGDDVSQSEKQKLLDSIYSFFIKHIENI